MQKTARPNEYRTTVVSVDSYKNCVPAGRIFNVSLNGSKDFQSLIEFFREMDQLLDSLKLPQSFSAVRSFQRPPDPEKTLEASNPKFRKGELATFSVRVIFRQNASWQGSVTWLDGDREESFRSALELAYLMDSVLSGAVQT